MRHMAHSEIVQVAYNVQHSADGVVRIAILSLRGVLSLSIA